jgi:flagellar hook-associated protein 1 FlgK
LRDTRDHLVDQLANIIDVNTHVTQQGDFLVYMGSIAIVDHDTNTEIGVETVNIDNRVRHNLVWKGTSIELTNLNGQLKGVMDARDRIIPSYLDRLDQLAQTLVEEVNAVHRTGYGADGSTGRNFFVSGGITAASIRVDPDIAVDATRIASSVAGEEGDFRIAKAIAEIQNATILNSNTTTINEFYMNMVATLGIETSEATSMVKNYEVLINQTENNRLAVQGVSLDEEMTNMVRFQQAYDAAARVITAMDEALDTVISGMGIVGR